MTLSAEDIRQLAKYDRNARGEWEWTLKRFIFPRRCSITGEVSGWFPKMYVGVRHNQITAFVGFRIVSVDALVKAKLKNEYIQ